MPFIPHTESEVSEMLSAIGANSIEKLFDEIPVALRARALQAVPEGLSEMEVARLMEDFAERDGRPLCFIGAGAYEHHIPAAVWQITTRGEFYSAYTPYQAEASQGTLQLIYEYQTMMASLTGMDVSNASLYEGASALAEAILMAVRANRKTKSRRILLPTSVNPAYRATVQAIVKNQKIELVELPYSAETGVLLQSTLAQYSDDDIAAVVIQQPNFFGMLEDVDTIINWASQRDIMTIAVVNPTTLAVLNSPGCWGENGADIACGEGQPLGAPLSSGGPYYGFLTCKQEHVRQMPGRIVGKTVDLDGKPGFALTLQAREQHIRRSKATSNICTNQGLVVTASTIYMSILGPEGLRRVATVSHANTRALVDKLLALGGVEKVFNGPFFHECALRFNRPAKEILNALEDQNILGGYHLANDYPELENTILICVTETKTEADLDRYTKVVQDILKA